MVTFSKNMENTDLNEPKMKLTVVSETIINIEMYVQGWRFELADESKAFVIVFAYCDLQKWS